MLLDDPLRVGAPVGRLCAMPISFPCPACKRAQVASVNAIGNRWRCECGVETVVPAGPGGTPAAALERDRLQLELDRAKLELERSALRRETMLPATAPPAAIVEADSDEIECESCAEMVKARAQVCKHCGHELGTKVRKKSRRLSRVEPAGPMVVIAKNPGMAAVLSFVWPGLGHLYAGRILFGLCFLTLWPVVYFMWAFAALLGEAGAITGGVAILALWVWQIYAAHNACLPDAPARARSRRARR